MSYDIEFRKDGSLIELPDPHNRIGGTFTAGGTTQAWLNVTYNYCEFYQREFGPKGIRALYGATAREVRPLLMRAIDALGTERVGDYWAATSGNAGAALADLLWLAEQVPDDAVMTGD